VRRWLVVLVVGFLVAARPLAADWVIVPGERVGPIDAGASEARLVELFGAANVERASFQVDETGLRHSVKVGDVIDFEIEDIVPFGIETGEPVRFNGMFHPVGSDLTMAEAKRSRINAFGISYEGKTGLSKSDFSWAV